MKVIYIAGPYKGKTKEERDKNIKEAEKVAKEIWMRGFVALCPHLNTARFDDDPDFKDDEQFYIGDLELLKRSDAILMFGDWRNSKGAYGEYIVAKAIGKTVLEAPENLDAFRGD